MDWNAIGAIGQAVSAVALLFVVLQVRHARVEMTRATRAARTDTLLGILQSQVSDASRTELLLRARQALGGSPGPFQSLLMERAGLTEAEAHRIQMHYTIWHQYYAEKVISYSSELSSADLFQANVGIRAHFGSSVGSLWFETMKPSLNPDSVRYIDNLLAQPG